MNAKQSELSPTPTVIVATEHEQVVRFYAGHAGNGGMHQTGQFTSSRPIDPTDLANMAVDLSNTFGWLVLDTAPVTAHRTLPQAPPHALPTAPTHKDRERKRKAQLVECPDKDCDNVVSRASIERHVQKQHGWTPAKAQGLYSSLPTTDKARKIQRGPQPHGVKRTTAALGHLPDGNRTHDWVVCPMPGCEHLAMRKNMAGHLQTRKHDLPKEGALKIARQAPKTDLRPDSRDTKRHGIAGARELEALLPQVATYVRTHGPVTGKDVARRFGVQTGTGTKWLKRLVERGEIVDVTNGSGIGVPRTFDRVPNSYTEPTVESVTQTE